MVSEVGCKHWIDIGQGWIGENNWTDKTNTTDRTKRKPRIDRADRTNRHRISQISRNRLEPSTISKPAAL